MSDQLPAGATIEPIDTQVTGKASLPPGATIEPYSPPLIAAEQTPVKPKRFESPQHTAMRSRISGLSLPDKAAAEADVVGTFKSGAENIAGAGGSLIAGPLGGAGAYLASKRLLEPGAISEHPIETTLNAGMYLTPELRYAKKIPYVGPLIEHYGERIAGSPLGRMVSEYAPKVADWISNAPSHLRNAVTEGIGLDQFPKTAPKVTTPIPAEAMTPQQTVEKAGGVYGGQHDAGHEIKLPTSMTKNLPIPDAMKPHVSVTIPADSLTVENVKAAMDHKVGEFTPAKPPSTRSLLDRLGSQVEESAKYPVVEPTARATPAQGTVGAKTVTEQPTGSEIYGPRINAPSQIRTEGEVARQVSPGARPLEPNVPLRSQKMSELRPSGPTIPGRSTGGSQYVETYADNPDYTPAEAKLVKANRQFIKPNGEEMHKAIMGKPELARDIFDLEDQQIQHVLRNSDPSMEDRVVTSAKYGEHGSSEKYGGTGHGKGISREDTLNYLMADRGMTAEQINKEAQMVPRIKPIKERTAFDYRDVGKAPPARRDAIHVGPSVHRDPSTALVNPLKPKNSGL